MKTVREEGLDWDVQQAQGPLYKIHSQMNHQGLRDLRQFVGNQHAETWSVTGSTQLITSRRGKNEGHIWRTGIDLKISCRMSNRNTIHIRHSRWRLVAIGHILRNGW